jgi:hypothetical protein
LARRSVISRRSMSSSAFLDTAEPAEQERPPAEPDEDQGTAGGGTRQIAGGAASPLILDLTVEHDAADGRLVD